MTYLTKYARLALVLSALALAACDRLPKPKVAEFQRVADECLLDVRDRNVPFAQSRHCARQLEPASRAVFDAYGYDEYQKLTAEARATAWSALALSNGVYRQHPPVLGLW